MKTLGEWLGEGSFTLAMSSSFFGFYSHCGIAAAFHERGLQASKFTGASAGALVGGGLASGLTPLEMSEILFSMKREDFWDPSLGLGYLRGQKLLKLLEKFYAPSFDQAKFPIEVAVFDILALRTKFLGQGSLPKAVAASCAVPLMFHPVRIDGRVFYDGGVLHKSGMRTENREERNLCILLESAAMAGTYEMRSHFKDPSPHHKVLRFKKLPQVHFNAMERGPAAFQAARERARKSLDLPLQNCINEA